MLDVVDFVRAIVGDAVVRVIDEDDVVRAIDERESADDERLAISCRRCGGCDAEVEDCVDRRSLSRSS